MDNLSPRSNFPAPRQKYAEPSKTYLKILRIGSDDDGFCVTPAVCAALGVKESALRSELTRLTCKNLVVAEKDQFGRNRLYRTTDDGRKALKAASK